jgi:DnaJ-class molecular chaperone
MSVERASEILEVPPAASREEIHQAYKDMAAIWHPDRFVHNPRLRMKAEQRLKEINMAREVLDVNVRKSHSSRRSDREAGVAEIIAETGTRLVLKAWWNLSRTFRRMAERNEQK